MQHRTGNVDVTEQLQLHTGSSQSEVLISMCQQGMTYLSHS